MIRNLLATTALATLMATASYAQDTTAPATQAPATTETAPATAPVARADGHLASNLIGEKVYNGTADNAEHIGDVNDVVIGKNGEVESVIIGVGGFLGLGEKNVAVNFSEVEWAERDGDSWMVVATTKEQLEAQAEFDPRAYEPVAAETAATDPAAPATDTTAMAPAAPATDDTAAAPADTAAPATNDTAAAPADTTAPATNETAAAPADTTAPATDDTAAAPAVPATDDTAAAPAAPATNETAAAPADTTATGTDATQTAAIDKTTLTEVPAGEMTAENLVGTNVYGSNDENVGEIGDIVLDGDKVDAIIIDVGGFLGIGAKNVAVGMDKLAFMTDADGNRYLYTNFTQEQLEAQPEYDESSYTENRDQQRMMVQ
ncbi:MAG: PRC-barrel domain-containing protein [Pseudaminobacter sp.]|nr:PRC-barrel domain-containing protein [Pseudaminobacter sp.]